MGGGGGQERLYDAKSSEKCPHARTALLKQISLFDTALVMTNTYKVSTQDFKKDTFYQKTETWPILPRPPPPKKNDKNELKFEISISNMIQSWPEAIQGHFGDV